MASGSVKMKFITDRVGSVRSGDTNMKNNNGSLKLSHIISGSFPQNFKVTGCYYTLYAGGGGGNYYAVYDQNFTDLNISSTHAKYVLGDNKDTNNLRLNLANNIYKNLSKLYFKMTARDTNGDAYSAFYISSSAYMELTIVFDILTEKLATPSGLKLASSVAVMTTPVVLSWDKVTNATGNNVSGYDIYRDGVFYKSVGNVNNAIVYCDKLGGSSYFQVLAKGSAGSGYYSGLSGSVTLKAYGKPNTPNLKTINGHTNQYISIGDSITSVPLVWDVVPAPANGSITGYRVYRSYDDWVTQALLTTVSATSYNAAIEQGRNASFMIIAVGSGNVASNNSRKVYANRISKPAAPTFTSPAAGGYEQTLSVLWDAVSVSNASITYKVQYCIGDNPNIDANWKDLTAWITTRSVNFYISNAEKGKYIRFRVQASATATHGGYTNSDWRLSTNAIYRYANPAKPSGLVLKDTATNKLDFSENELTVTWDYAHPILGAAFNMYEVQVSIGGNNNWKIVQYISNINTKSYKYNINEFVSRGQTVYFRIVAADKQGAYTFGDQKSIVRNSLLKISTVSSTISGNQGFPYLNLSFIPAIGRYGQTGTYTIGIYKSSNYKKTLINKKTIIFSGATIESGLNITIPNLKDVCTDLYNDVIINKKINQKLIFEIILEDKDFPDAKTIYSSEINLNYGVSPSKIDNLKITLLSSHTDGTIDYANAGDSLKIEYDAVIWKNADNSEIGKNIKYEIRIENIVKTTTDLTEIDMVLEEYGDNTSVLFSVTAYQEYADENTKSSVAYYSFGYARTLNAKEVVVKTIKKSDSLAEGIINIQDLGTSPVWGNFQKIEVIIETNPVNRIEISPIILQSNKNSGTIDFVLDGLGKDKQELIITLSVYNTSNKIVTTILPIEYIRELLVTMMIRDKFVGINTSSEYDYNGDKESFRIEGKEDNVESAVGLFQAGNNNKRGSYLKFLVPGISQDSAEVGFDGEDLNFIFNNQKYMIYSTRDKIPVSSLEGILPEGKGGLGADNFNQGRGNLMDITSLITSENLNDFTFFRQFTGRTVAYITNVETQNGALAPTSWGILTTERAGTATGFTQQWQDALGNVFIRGANNRGWNNDTAVEGKDAWQEVFTRKNFMPIYYDYAQVTESTYLKDVVNAMPVNSMLVAMINPNTPLVTPPERNNFPTHYGVLEIIKTNTRFEIALYESSGSPTIGVGNHFWKARLNSGTNEITWYKYHGYLNDAVPVGAKHLNGYWGLTDSAGVDTGFYRTPVSGLIPYQSGGGNSQLGTSSWPFAQIHAKGIYEAGATLASRYASIGHGHAGVYAPTNHSHAASNITSGILVPDRGGTGVDWFERVAYRDIAAVTTAQYFTMPGPGIYWVLSSSTSEDYVGAWFVIFKWNDSTALIYPLAKYKFNLLKSNNPLQFAIQYDDTGGGTKRVTIWRVSNA